MTHYDFLADSYDAGIPIDAAQEFVEGRGAIPTSRSKPERVAILEDGAALTDGARDTEYGPPAVNLGCSGELKAVIRKWATRTLSPAEQEAIDMVLTKIGRVVTGKPKRDTYVDGATYFAIAGEVALSG